MVTIYTNYFRDDPYVWKCTECRGRKSKAIVGFTYGIDGLRGSGVCYECLPKFIKATHNTLHKRVDIFVPWTLPTEAKLPMLRLLAVIFKNKGGINVQVSP